MTGEQDNELQLPREEDVTIVASVIEIILAVLALVGISYLDLDVTWGISTTSTAIGAVGALVLFLLNSLLLYLGDRGRYKLLSEFSRFRDEIAMPLAARLSNSNALALSVLAGLCEELFFRGFLQPAIGIALTGCIFALLHFGPRVKEWKLMAGVYLGVSLFFSSLLVISGTLWAPIVAHTVYDALVLRKLKSHSKE